MQFGLIVQMTGSLGFPQPLARLAREAEAAGWDGFFIWDVFRGDAIAPTPVVEPWIAMAAMAAATERIRFGPMVTPLPRRRPWKLAREAASLDHLSSGRLILGVGIGDQPGEFSRFGETADPRVRARMLDEGLEVLTGLWSGEPFSHHGEHYRIEEALLLPRPVQQPRIPIWVGGTWPRKPAFRRAARWDGVFPGSLHGNLTLDELREMRAYVEAHRTTDEPFDVMAGGDVPFDDPARARAILAEYAEAGVSWWVEGIGEWRGDIDAMAAFHLCWGSWQGPHLHDLGLRDIVDLVLRVRAQAYSVEAATPRHSHEWRVWQDIRLPEGKVLIPGVIAHTTAVVEHPETVAERLMNFASLVGRERVIAGADCGFAQGALFQRQHPTVMWAKFEALVQGARLASERLWG